MDEVMMSNDIRTFVDSIQSLVDIDGESLENQELMDAIMESIKSNIGPVALQQSVRQIILNLEAEGATRDDAIAAMKAIKDFVNEMVYGEHQYSGNKEILIKTIIEATFEIFDEVIEKYHRFAIDLPMTIEEGAKVPTYAHETDAAADLYAMEDVILPGNSKGNKIRTGVKIELPESWLALIIPRSSIGAKTPLRLSNSVGLIDSGYRGELGVLYDNTSDKPYDIHAGDRIAQLLVMPSYRFRAKVVDELTDSDRGETGFGDSGK